MNKKIIISFLIGMLVFGIVFQVNQKYHHIGGATRHEILKQIEEIEGNQYVDKVILARDYQKHEIQIRESKKIQLVVDKICPWDSSMPREDLEGNLLSKTHMITVYGCQVVITRYAVVDEVVVPDSKTNKYINYTAYEDRDLNSVANVVVNLDTRECIYSDTQEYFENIYEHIKNSILDKGKLKKHFDIEDIKQDFWVLLFFWIKLC